MRASWALGAALVLFGGGCALVMNFGDYDTESPGECKNAADCGEETQCLEPTCVGGSCKFVGKPKGTRFDLIAEDCMAFECDGNGGVLQAVASDTDVPATVTTCVVARCEGGEITMANADAGTMCGDGLECDGEGHCAGCTENAQCEDGSACLSWVCSSEGTCVPEIHDGEACGEGPRCELGQEYDQQVCEGGTCKPATPRPCSPYVCDENECKTECEHPEDCAGGVDCQQGSCGNACDPVHNGAICNPPMCRLDGHSTTYGVCNGGDCEGAIGECSPYRCAAGQCNVDCDGPGDCMAGASCDGGACCVTCVGWMGGVTGSLCTDQDQDSVEQMRTCACVTSSTGAETVACPACEANVCEGTNTPPTPACAACILLKCTEQTKGCRPTDSKTP